MTEEIKIWQDYRDIASDLAEHPNLRLQLDRAVVHMDAVDQVAEERGDPAPPDETTGTNAKNRILIGQVGFCIRCRIDLVDMQAPGGTIPRPTDAYFSCARERLGQFRRPIRTTIARIVAAKARRYDPAPMAMPTLATSQIVAAVVKP